jgi:ubiquinone/menaquinone biosynthesis C-methylase UbiE
MTGLDRLPETDPTSILRSRDGIYAVDVLTAAVAEARIFDFLREHPSTLFEVCGHYGWALRPADVLITLCKAYGYLSESAEGFITATPQAVEHLCEGSPWNLSEYYSSLRDRPVVADYVRVLKTGKPAHWSGLDEADDDWHGAMLNEDFAKTFTAAMDCRGVFLGKKLADAVGGILSTSRRVLDIGGGSGVYACALAANQPDLEAIVLEQEPVDAIARGKIEERGLSDRVRVEVGNMFADPWPESCDLHLFSNVMHDWDVPDILTLLKRSRETLAEGGHVLIHETFLNREKTGPVPVAEYSCILAHSTQGRCYAVGEMESYLEEAGFAFLSFQETGGDRGVIVAETK